ncbi:MAG: hypothetical protein P8O21_01040, partial [Ilumatobacter sp.]|nr:hypothetical protein [Ilumatobacter sp.]
GSGSQSTFVAMTPCRLVDTRAPSVDNTAVVQDEGALGKESKRTYTAAGSCGVPSNATSLSVNLAAITPTLNTFMTLWDTGSDRPNSSAVNPEAALSVTGNTTNVALSSSGQFDIYNNAGQVDYVIDVLGYYAKPPKGDEFGTVISTIKLVPDTSGCAPGQVRLNVSHVGLTEVIEDGLTDCMEQQEDEFGAYNEFVLPVTAELDLSMHYLKPRPDTFPQNLSGDDFFLECYPDIQAINCVFYGITGWLNGALDTWVSGGNFGLEAVLQLDSIG